jgi:hypothetical protein
LPYFGVQVYFTPAAIFDGASFPPRIRMRGVDVDGVFILDQPLSKAPVIQQYASPAVAERLMLGRLAAVLHFEIMRFLRPLSVGQAVGLGRPSRARYVKEYWFGDLHSRVNNTICHVGHG